MARFVVTVPDDFLKEIDARAKAEHRSRSELAREALRAYLRSGVRKGGISDRSEVKRALRIQEETRRLLEVYREIREGSDRQCVRTTMSLSLGAVLQE